MVKKTTKTSSSSASSSGSKSKRPARAPVSDVVTREFTINLHKRLHGITFKKRAPRALVEIKKFASRAMKTNDVRIDTSLNKFIWSKGIRNVPYRVRVKLNRRRNEDEEAQEKLYTHVTHVIVPTYKGTENVTIKE